ncbi:unnamed protein product [Didymodactylos carnosus]|uniref:NAD(P)(+)--arginine ADP-ribosyltransferase n=2 Tax=Didymodactylos carnosus TaxID=1234261 RepID=A0A8S2ET49_9BILA|nr:unnamed protein product [Didymodactylos carnosus]CAF4099799.1 unnamed protein product [Didymodactylos carnosus]
MDSPTKEENVWIAKQNCQNPQDGLSQNESASIHLYTMQFTLGESLYVVLNRTLRAENRDDLKPWFKFLKLFMTALFKMNSIRATVWRGIRDVDLSGKYKKGVKFAWWGVSSCTTTIDVIETFLGKTGIRTIFSVACLNGKSIIKHSYFSVSEQEIILTPGTYFKVVGQVNPAEGLHIIQLKEIQPPYLQQQLRQVVGRHLYSWQNIKFVLLLAAFIGGMIAIGMTYSK